MNTIENFADLKQVKLMKTGTHNGLQVDAAILNLMARSTMEALDYLKESIEMQSYAGNTVNLGGRPIPALLNLNHQEDLPDVMRTALSGVTLDKMYVKDGWLTADYGNVPPDVAKFLKAKYPLRSVEILPPIYHPKKQKILPYVVRSVALLDASMPPAVKGQANDFVVMYSALDGGTIETYTMEVDTMDKKQEETPITPPGNEQQIAEFKAQLDAQKAAAEAEIKKRDEQIAALSAQMKAQQDAAEKQAVNLFCDDLILSKGVKPDALRQDVRDQLLKLNHSEVMEFSDGKKSQRAFWMDYIASLLPGVAGVPQGQIAAFQAHRAEGIKSELEEIESFRAQAEKQANNPKDEREVFMKMNDLWLMSKRGGN
jgi:hypothetical protein